MHFVSLSMAHCSKHSLYVIMDKCLAYNKILVLVFGHSIWVDLLCAKHKQSDCEWIDNHNDR